MGCGASGDGAAYVVEPSLTPEITSMDAKGTKAKSQTRPLTASALELGINEDLPMPPKAKAEPRPVPVYEKLPAAELTACLVHSMLNVSPAVRNGPNLEKPRRAPHMPPSFPLSPG